jgi:iron(III) transport system permease protein
MPLRWLQRFFLLLILVMLCVPVLAVMGSWLQWDVVTADILQQMGSTVLPDYAWTTLRLCLMVALGTVVIGSASAAAVTLFEFPGRRVAEWALLLPLAMPAYVVAYAYTDFLQFSGPLQTGLRAVFGLEGRVFPEVRSLGGAAWMFTFSLYPYVYLLARTALGERATHLMEAARLLGAPMSRRIREVALPLARPAIAAGAALALMETLADFGVSSYFGIQTFSAGIYKAWLAMDNRIAAAQLATVLLVVVMVLLNLEHRAQKRMRFLQRARRSRQRRRGPSRAAGRDSPRRSVGGLHGACAAGFRAAGDLHAASAGGRLVGIALDGLCRLVLQQRAARYGHRLGGRRHGAVVGFQCAP